MTLGAWLRSLILRLSVLGAAALLLWELAQHADVAGAWLAERARSLWEGYTTLPLWAHVLLGGVLAVVALYLLFGLLADVIAQLILWGGRARSVTGAFQEQRHVVLCIDGTWNHPGQLSDGVQANTNVYRFWDALAGRRSRFREHFYVAADRYKMTDLAPTPPADSSTPRSGDATDGRTGPPLPRRQISLYYTGVGNRVSHTVVGQVLGGAFGMGAGRLVRRTYQDLMKYYRADARYGDRLTIVGFSRGAAIARLLASRLEREGIPKAGVFASGLLYPLWRLLGPLWKGLGTRPRVDFLGVWDTVAAFGISKNVLGIPFQRINLFKDFNVSAAVDRAVHLVSSDDARDAFQPTPLRVAPGNRCQATETWMAGVHTSVGGGGSDDLLSRIALEYMVLRATDWAEEAPPGGYWIEFPHVPARTSTAWAWWARKGKIQAVKSPLYGHERRRIPIDAWIHWTVRERYRSAQKPYDSPAVNQLIQDVVAQRARLARGMAELDRPYGDAAGAPSTANTQEAEAVERVRLRVDWFGGEKPAPAAPPTPTPTP